MPYDPKKDFKGLATCIAERLTPQCIFIHRYQQEGGQQLNDLASALYHARIYGNAYIYPTRKHEFDKLYTNIKKFHQNEYVKKGINADITFVDA